MWPRTTTGKYNTKSGYRTLYDNKNIPGGEHHSQAHLYKGRYVWNSIWHLDLPERLKVFLWKCVRGILPVNLGLSSRLHQLSSNCPLCNQLEEKLGTPIPVLSHYNVCLGHCRFHDPSSSTELHFQGLATRRDFQPDFIPFEQGQILSLHCNSLGNLENEKSGSFFQHPLPD